MSGLRQTKLVALKIRQHTMCLTVLRKLKALGYTGIQRTGWTSPAGVRLVVHDFIAYGGLFVMVRAVGHTPHSAELDLLRQGNAYLQLGATHIDGLVLRMDAARASKAINTVRHWSTVGNSD